MSPADHIRTQLLQVLALLERHPDLEVISTDAGRHASVFARSIAPLLAAYPGVAVRPEMTMHGLFRYITIDGVECSDLLTITPEQLSTLAAARVGAVS